MNLIYTNEATNPLRLGTKKATEEVTVKEAKNVNVLIDLLGYGIVELPVTYSLNFENTSPKVCHVACHISLSEPTIHTWLYLSDFNIIVTEIDGCPGHIVSFNGAGLNENIYYQTMINVVSDYILLKDKMFD